MECLQLSNMSITLMVWWEKARSMIPTKVCISIIWSLGSFSLMASLVQP
jgi:hypothetical protein